MLVEAAFEFFLTLGTREMFGMPTFVHRRQHYIRDNLPTPGTQSEEQHLVVSVTIGLTVFDVELLISDGLIAVRTCEVVQVKGFTHSLHHRVCYQLLAF